VRGIVISGEGVNLTSGVSVEVGEAKEGVTVPVATGGCVGVGNGVTGESGSAGEQAAMIRMSHGMRRTFFVSIFSPDRKRYEITILSDVII
jgi:hypothetical protein